MYAENQEGVLHPLYAVGKNWVYILHFNVEEPLCRGFSFILQASIGPQKLDSPEVQHQTL